MGACITKKSNIVIKKINRNLKQQIGSPEIKTSKYQSSKNFNFNRNRKSKWWNRQYCCFPLGAI